MPDFTKAERWIITNYIPHEFPELSESLTLIREAIENIWAKDASRVYVCSDYGIGHVQRVAGFVEKLLQVNPKLEFSEQEIYLLLAGVYLHDIGLQCDIAKNHQIKEKAEDLGAKFKEAFTVKTTNNYSLKEQKEIHENHHFLSAAWIDYLYWEKNDKLHVAIKSVPSYLVEDLIDICKFHSKLSIDDCDDIFKLDTNKRKRLVAAILRFADQLDISCMRVKSEMILDFNLSPEKSVYWWLHNYTKVIFNKPNKFLLKIWLHPEDFKLYSSFVRGEYITNFKNKNHLVLDVLIEYGINVEIDEYSSVVEYDYADKFPLEIKKIFDKEISRLSESDADSQERKKETQSIKREEKPVLNNLNLETTHEEGTNLILDEFNKLNIHIYNKLNVKYGRSAAKYRQILIKDYNIIKYSEFGVKIRKTNFNIFEFLYHRSIMNYKNSVYQQYSKMGILFRPDSPLILQDIYVPVRLYQSQKNDNINPRAAVQKYKRLAIIGNPGSGKSIMLRHLLLSYIDDTSTIFSDNKFPILLELRNFTKQSTNLFDEFLVILHRNGFTNGEMFLENCLKTGNLIIFMDGLDEINVQEKGRVIQDIKYLATKYPDISFVITCRSSVYNNELYNIIEQTFEIAEFDDNQIFQFLTSWESELPPNKSVNQLLKTLHDRPSIMEVIRNPLMLTIFAYLYCDTMHELAQSRAEFYKISCDVLLNTWQSRYDRYSPLIKREVLKYLALINQDNSEELSLKTIDCKSVIEGLRRLLQQFHLGTDDCEFILKEIVERSGLLIITEGGNSYQFVHLAFQEYFSAEALINNHEGLINRFSASPNIWRETVKLWCDLSSDCTSLIRKLYEIDPTLTFECLANNSKLDTNLADSIISEFEARFIVETSSEKVQTAFGNVASNVHTLRGINVFKFLVTVLESNDLDSKIRECAAFSLSITNLPMAAEILVRNLPNLECCKILLIGMGDIAVEAIVKSDLKNSISQVEILLEIGTPQAAKAIVPYLWVESDIVSYTAAWSLGSLIKDRNIEEVLRNYQFQEENKFETLDWIWLPFEDSSSLSLSKICGRIGYVLNTFDPVPGYFETFTLDERISIPLFISNMLDSDYTRIKYNREICDTLKDSKLINILSLDILRDNKILTTRQSQNNLIDKVNFAMKQNNRLWLFFNSMNAYLKLRIIYIILRKRKVTKNDWININKKSKFHISELSEKRQTALIMFTFIPFGIISFSYIFFNVINYIHPLLFLFNVHFTIPFSIDFYTIFNSLIIAVIISMGIFHDQLIENKRLMIILSMPMWILILIAESLANKEIYRARILYFRNFFPFCVFGTISNYFVIKFMNEMFFISFLDMLVVYVVIIILLVTIKIELQRSTNPLNEVNIKSLKNEQTYNSQN